MTTSGEAPALSPPVGARDHAQGPAGAPLTLVEYGDFECPFCSRVTGSIDEVSGRTLAPPFVMCGATSR